MTKEVQEFLDYLDECYEANLLYPTGYEDAIVGIVERFGMSPVILLDKERILSILVEDMTREEAEEFFDYNILGGWHGEATPAFVTFTKDLIGR